MRGTSAALAVCAAVLAVAGLLWLRSTGAEPWMLRSVVTGELGVECRRLLPTPHRVAIPVEGVQAAGWLYEHADPRGRAVLVHGADPRGHANSTARLLGMVMHRLGHEVLAIELRGWGDSPPPLRPETPEAFDYGKDVAAALTWWNARAATGGRSTAPVLVGHSLGGGAVVRARARGVPARGSIAVGPPFHEALFAADPTLAERRSRRQLRDMKLEPTPERVAALAKALLEIDPTRLPARGPLLLVHGEHEDHSHARRLAGDRREVEAITVAGVGHDLGYLRRFGPCELSAADAPAQLERAIGAWLQTLPK